ncbi:MAG: hypothetical protein HYU52_10630 [Acidobacteria bacterium]|nr:hypothetical protein [Acidobacteriota bacterium]
MTSGTERSPTGESRFALLVTLAWTLATLPRLLTHELWRDEAWLWLVALDSHSLPDLFQPLARSGQGYLFPILCFVARQFSESPRAMQFLHLAVATGATFVLARWAPFTRLERVLLLLGYFTFYEYAVISRHYVVGMLLLWLACIFASRRQSAIGVGIALGLACQTTVYAFIVAIAILCGWMLDRRLRRSELEPLSRRDVAIGLTMGIAGAIAGLVQLIPSAGTSFAPGWKLAWNAELALKVLRIPWRVFMPLPRLQMSGWNLNMFDAWPLVEAAGGAALLLITIAMLARRKVALATFSIGAAGLLAFGYAKFVGEMRHGGHLVLLFVAAIWLAGGLESRAETISWRSYVFKAMLVLQCLAAMSASWVDLRHPFSTAPLAVALLRREGLDRLPLLGHREPPAASIALALGRPLFAPSRGIYAKYPDWGPTQREMGNPQLRCVARALARRETQDIALVINRALPEWGELDAAGSVSGSICRSEDYHLYRLRYDRLDATESLAQCDAMGR